MSAPFTFQGTLTFPADPGGQGTAIAVNFASNFSQLIAETSVLTGSGTKVIDLSDLNGGAGASLVLVKVDAAVSGTPPVNLRWNGGASSGEQEISAGGFAGFGSGTPASGLTSLSILYTGNATVRVWALG